jgi:hypothetical protein
MNQNINNIGQAPQQAYVAPTNEHQPLPQTNTVPTAPLDDSVVVSVRLDKESIEILNMASPLFSESIVNLGIKMMAGTEVFKAYMLKDRSMHTVSAAPIDGTSSPVQNISAGVQPQAQSTAPAPTPVAAGGGFSKW